MQTRDSIHCYHSYQFGGIKETQGNLKLFTKKSETHKELTAVDETRTIKVPN